MGLGNIIAKLNKNKFFSFISSVRLAVPTMVILCIAVGWGTVLESLYNADYAGLIVYKSVWFSMLMLILWLNIFCATVSRYPFKKHHVGFVITHIGLLILLAGGLVTNRFGIDGQMQVVEGSRNNSVYLPRLMVGYQVEGSNSLQRVVFDRSLSTKEFGQLDFINKELGSWFKVNQYIPFARVEKSYSSSSSENGETSISFMMKSRFFNVTEWLSTHEEPEKQMGPATLRIVKGEFKNGSTKKVEIAHKAPRNKSKPNAKMTPSQDSIQISEDTTGKVLKKITTSEALKAPLNINGVFIRLSKKFKNAVVAANKLEEGDPSGNNVALEFEVKKGAESKREVLYAKFANFSLHPEGLFGLRIQYISSTSSSSEENPLDQSNELAEDSMPRPGGNVIEFHIVKGKENKVQVVLFKNGDFVQEAWLQPGESLQTPWMGMQLFIGSIIPNSESTITARKVDLEKKGSLPPSALELSFGPGQPNLWLAEGDEREVLTGNKKIHVFFGRENINLPFDIALQKFSKIDYPGTETPMSFESQVQINGQGPSIKISMNEPLKIEGFTIYQASYSMQPNSPPISVFSINQDPGRFWKYLGSIILSIGVIVYTLMKSRLFRNTKKGN